MEEIKQSFHESFEVKSFLMDISYDVESSWASLMSVLYESAKKTLWYVHCKHQDWFDDNHPQISSLLDQMCKAHQPWIFDKKSAIKKIMLLSKQIIVLRPNKTDGKKKQWHFRRQLTRRLKTILSKP